MNCASPLPKLQSASVLLASEKTTSLGSMPQQQRGHLLRATAFQGIYSDEWPATLLSWRRLRGPIGKDDGRRRARDDRRGLPVLGPP